MVPLMYNLGALLADLVSEGWMADFVVDARGSEWLSVALDVEDVEWSFLLASTTSVKS